MSGSMSAPGAVAGTFAATASVCVTGPSWLTLPHRMAPEVSRVPIIVQKYGGSSVADVQKIQKVADRVAATTACGPVECRGVKVAGFGFRKGAGVDSLMAALAGVRVDAVATVVDKVEGLQGLGLRLDVPVIGVARGDLVARPGSDLVRQLYGTGSVAEGSALAAAGIGAVLVGARVRSPDGMAVVAIAEGPG